MKISHIDGTAKNSTVNRRLLSSRSLISSQMSSSKWLKDNDFTSLPFLENQPISSGKIQRKPVKGILKNGTPVLPPIEQFRSISATPRRPPYSVSGHRSETPKYFFVRNSIVRKKVGRRKIDDL